MMAIAPSAQESERESGYIIASYVGSDRLVLVFGVNIDPDLPPLPSDLCIIADNKRIGAASLDIQLDKAQAVVTLLLEAPLDRTQDEMSFVVRYRPTQWLMCIDETGEAIDAFDEEIFPQPITLLDPELHSKTSIDKPAQANDAVAKLVEANIRSASEYRIQLYFNDHLDTSMPLEVSDFRAELQDRWLHITSAKYIKSHSEDCPEIRLELSEPMEPGGVVQVGYRSPGNRLRTLDAEPLAPFSVSARVDRTLGHHIQDDEAELESVAVTLNEPEPTPESSLEDSLEASQTENVAETDEALDLIAELNGELSDEAEFEPDSVLDELDAMTDELPSSEAAHDTSDEVDEVGKVNPPALTTVSDPEQESAESIKGENFQAEDESQNNLDTGASDLDAEAIETEIINVSEAEESALALENTEDELPKDDELSEAVLDDASGDEQAVLDADHVNGVDSDEALASAETDTMSVAKEVITGKLEDAETTDAATDTITGDVDGAHAETIADKAARIQKALESKSVLPVTKPPLTLAAKFFYIIPMVVFGWLLIVILIYVATIVFDLNLGGKAEGPVPIVAVPSKIIPRETCSMRSADGSQYKGQCLNGKREGQGVYTWATGNRYEGQWHNGQRHGQGVLNYATGAVYQGEYRAGVEHGTGKMAWPNGAVYEGEYSEGKFHGKGIYISADGSRFEGMFDSGSMTQEGECTLPSGEKAAGPCIAN
ncbi:MAG: hypothetical protein K6L80_06750 [Agarilytica sp.]